MIVLVDAYQVTGQNKDTAAAAVNPADVDTYTDVDASDAVNFVCSTIMQWLVLLSWSSPRADFDCQSGNGELEGAIFWIG